MERPLRPLVSSPKNVLVLGGTGFVGRHVVPKLVAAGHRVVVPTRRRDRARPLFLLPTCTVVEADIHDRGALARLARGTDALVNLVGILHESGRDTFARAHVELPRNAIAACRDAGVRRLVHMSALNAAPDGPSRYQRSKGEAEALVEASGLDWTIFRPSVIFGRGDSFLSMFAKLVRLMPVVALASADARFQPVWIGDVAHCFATAVDDPRTVGQRYDLCGPAVYTLRELVAKVGAITGHPRRSCRSAGVVVAAGTRARDAAGPADDARQSRVDDAGQRLRLPVPAAIRHRPGRARGGRAGLPRADVDPQPLRRLPRARRALSRPRRRRPGADPAMAKPLPQPVRIYRVGGSVRDEILGRAVADHDYVVVGATPELMIASGFRPVAATSRCSCTPRRRRSTRSRGPSASRAPAIAASPSSPRPR